MEGFRYLVIHLCLALIGSCQSKSIDKVAQWEGKKFAQTLEDDLEEEDALNSRLKNVLGTMKEDFLRMLNLSGVPQEQRKVQPPPFMMELYNKYASDKSSIPQSDVIRSFAVQDVTQSVISENKTVYRLQFNISVPAFEEISMVQLRLYMDGDGAQEDCDDIFTVINIYDVVHRKYEEILHLLDRKDISETEDIWEAFDVTNGVLSWLESGHGGGELEVVTESWGCGSFKGGGFNVSLSVGDVTSPVLIVFSDDSENRKRKASAEVGTYEDESFLMRIDTFDDYANEVHLTRHPRRRKRRAPKNYCRRTSLRVNFKDIGWDQWIVAPTEYEAYECKGVCSFPLTDDVTPSKHAIIQTLVNLSNPKKANKACCVPTELDPLTVMYQENGVITVRHLYKEMKVAKCGCR